jgi:hypothetical protein
MNTVYLAIWFTVNGHSAMYQAPIDAAHCDAMGQILTTGHPNVAYACVDPDNAAKMVAQWGCRLVGRDEQSRDSYICRKGF